MVEKSTVSLPNTGNFNPNTYSFLDYSPGSAGNIKNGTGDVTAPLQNFLLYCQLQAYAFKGTAGDNLMMRDYVRAYLPRGNYQITSPILVPELVRLIGDGTIVRAGAGGTGTTPVTWTGSSTQLALGNYYQPAVIFVPTSHAETLNILCTSNGSALSLTWKKVTHA